MNKHIPSKVVQVLLPAFALVSFAGALAAGDDNRECDCSNATLNGSYGLHATGTVIAVGDFAAVGRFTFDRKGNLIGQLFTRVAGNNANRPTFTGTYSVSPDCIVTETWGAPVNSTHLSVIVDHGKGYFTLNTSSGLANTISGEARKQ